MFAITSRGQVKVKMEHYSTEDGLSHNNVTSIIKTSDGFMWFGTWDGINRFDGHNFITYKSHPGDSSGLKTNRIDRIVEDRSGFLWLRPYDNQIYRFDKKTGKLLSIADLLATANITNIKFDKVIPSIGGQVWLTTLDQGVFCVINAAGESPELKRYAAGMPQGQQLPSDIIRFLYEDQLHNVWVGTAKGLCCLSAATGGVYKNRTTGVEVFNGRVFTCVAEGPEKIWFGTNTGELVFYEKSSMLFNSKKISANQLNAVHLSKKSDVLYVSTSAREIITLHISNLTMNRSVMPGKAAFYSMYEDKSGQLWIEPEKDGIIKYDPASKSFKYFFQENDATLNYPVKLYGVFEDNQNRVWVSMTGGGFGYYNPAKDAVEYFYNKPGSADRRFSNIVGVRYFDPAGILWFTSSDRGIEKIIFQQKDLDPELMVQVTSNKTDNDVRGIYNDRKNRIWLASKSGKVYMQDTDGKRITNFFVNEPAGGIGGVYTILQDRNGDIWLGTKGNGLFKAVPVDSNATKYTLTQYRSDKNDIYSLSSNLIYSLLEDKRGRIWVGTFENGLNMMVKTGDKLTFINANNDLKNYPTASAGKIRHLQLDVNGKLWIATTNGLLIADVNPPAYRDYQFIPYRKTPGDKTSLSNNDLQFIFRDAKNRMWISTSGGGLNETILHNKGLQFKVFTRQDGLPSDYILSIVEDKIGNLWMGTENGLCKFNPDKNLFRNYDSYDGLMKAGFSEASGIRLHNDNLLFGTVNGYVIFNPSTVSSQKLRANMVFTNLQVNNKDVPVGADGSPLQVDINNTGKIELRYNENIISIDFTILDYISNDKQTFTYRLKGFDKDWNNVVNQHRATYTNLPYGEYVFEVKSLSEDLYEKRPVKTLAITILPPPWKTWWAYLIYVIVIGTILFFIRRNALAMLRLRNKIAVEQKLAVLKLSFFTNVSHELRTPLTLIVSPLEQLSRMEPLTHEGRSLVATAQKNAGRMVRFINQLLDLRKVQSGKATLRISRVDIVGFVKGICDHFTQAARSRQIQFDIIEGPQELFAWVDVEKLDVVIYNLLSNALKFTPEGKAIRINIRTAQEESAFLIEVYDQGPGVTEEKLEDIFELFHEEETNTRRQLKGTGIGLALSRELVNLHGGSIRAMNNKDGGLSVIVKMKTGKEHYYTGDQVLFVDMPDIQDTSETNKLQVRPQPFYPAAPKDQATPLVLLVEDNEELRHFLKGQLGEYYRVETAGNGEEGYQKAGFIGPDLIVSDIMMPVMDGIQMLDKLRNDTTTSHIPVVLLTAKHSIESQIEGLKYGADYYITKPFNNEFLIAAIDNLLKKRNKRFESLVQKKPSVALSPEPIVITSKDENFLKEVIAVVEDKMGDIDFNIDLVAASMAMSRGTFYKKFKSFTGLTPVEFVRDMRLQRALQYLDNGGKNVSEIAYLVGFNHPKYFSTCFKEKYEVSPSDYQRAKIK
ncbi:MAG: response regulator [Ferruginibacter sp.]|nr:response regulator [Ferruginibacter sp.]